MTGYDLLCRTLETLEVEYVFGLPGSQNVAFFESLRKSRLRIVVPNHEMAAAFMAIGLSRASGKVGVVTTIPGPGFTYVLTALAEARLDSVPLLCIVQSPAEGPGNRFQLQRIDQESIAGPLVKRIFQLDDVASLEAVVGAAYDSALEGEPGPVLIQVDHAVVAAELAQPRQPSPRKAPAVSPVPRAAIRETLDRLASARRPLLLVGQGGNGAVAEIRAVAERLRCPVLTSTSARGVLPEDHPMAVPSDLCDIGDLNVLIKESDLLLALGIKFSHNGARGFRMRIPADRLVHIDASEEVVGANYPPSLGIHSDVPRFVSQLARQLGGTAPIASLWTVEEIATWRARVRAGYWQGIEPRVGGSDPPTPAGFFAALRKLIPPDAILVTDSGWHQMLARRYFPVLSPRGLIVPTDFQSMGYGLPAALGAKLAQPSRPVVLLTGDGSMLMSGMALVAGVQHRISLPVIVFNDGHYGLIRMEQLRAYGQASGVVCDGLEFEAFAAATGARYALADQDIREPLTEALAARVPTVIEVPLGTFIAAGKLQARAAARRLAGGRIPGWLKRRR